MQCSIAGVPTAANISAIAGFPGDVASAVSMDSAVPILISAVGLAWAQALIMVYVGSCIPAAAVDVPGVLAVSRVSADAAVLSTVVSRMLHEFPTSWVLMLLMSLLLLASILFMLSLIWLTSLLLMVFPSVLTSLLLFQSPDFSS